MEDGLMKDGNGITALSRSCWASVPAACNLRLAPAQVAGGAVFADEALVETKEHAIAKAGVGSARYNSRGLESNDRMHHDL